MNTENFVPGSAIPQEAHGKYSGINVKGPAAFYPQLRFASRTFTADIRVNFGQEPFRFDIIKYCELLGNRFSKFKRDATNLPSEILHKILTLAVSTHPDTTGTVGALQPADTPRLDESHLGLSRLALVCRHWARHSRTALYRSVILHHQEQVERFKNLILKSPQEWYPGLFIQLLGAVDAASPEIGLLLLSTLPRRLQRLRTLIWGERQSLDNSAVAPRTAHNRYPPQFLVLMPSLFQAFSALQFLTLRGLRFSSFSRFARLICSITKLETLGIDDVHWPEAAPDLDTPPGWFRRPRLLRRVETANMDSIGSSSCMGDIAWFFVGRLSRTPSHHSSPLRSNGLLLPHFDELDATIIPRILVSVATRQYEDHRDSSDGGFSSAYIISMEDKHEPRAGCKYPSGLHRVAPSSRQRAYLLRGADRPKHCCRQRMDACTAAESQHQRSMQAQRDPRNHRLAALCPLRIQLPPLLRRPRCGRDQPVQLPKPSLPVLRIVGHCSSSESTVQGAGIHAQLIRGYAGYTRSYRRLRRRGNTARRADDSIPVTLLAWRLRHTAGSTKLAHLSCPWQWTA